MGSDVVAQFYLRMEEQNLPSERSGSVRPILEIQRDLPTQGKVIATVNKHLTRPA